jgi:hypothetical protein
MLEEKVVPGDGRLDMRQTQGGTWLPPWWALSSVAQDESIEHERRVGRVLGSGGREPLQVDVVQREVPALLGDAVQVALGQKGVRVAGVRLTPVEAQQLAGMLVYAASLLTQDEAGHWTEPVAASA